MKVETHKGKTTFTLTVDAREYWLMVKALGILDNYEISDTLKSFDDENNTEEFIHIKHNLYAALISKINDENNTYDSSDGVYEKFKEDGEL